MKAILLVSHGSRSSKTKKEVAALVDKIRTKTTAGYIDYAFLEIESPSIPEGIKRCVDAGAKEILLLMNFLNSGRHMDQDIPVIVKEQQARFPKVPIRMSRPVGQHDGITGLFIDLINS